MIRRLEHWLEVMPPVEGADIKLLDPVQTRQLCTSADMPAATGPSSHTDDLQRSSATDADSGAHLLVAEEASESAALQYQQDECSDSLQPPDFPLLPVSRGFHMKLQKLLAQFETTLTTAGIMTSRSGSPS